MIFATVVFTQTAQIGLFIYWFSKYFSFWAIKDHKFGILAPEIPYNETYEKGIILLR